MPLTTSEIWNHILLPKARERMGLLDQLAATGLLLGPGIGFDQLYAKYLHPDLVPRTPSNTIPYSEVAALAKKYRDLDLATTLSPSRAGGGFFTPAYLSRWLKPNLPRGRHGTVGFFDGGGAREFFTGGKPVVKPDVKRLAKLHNLPPGVVAHEISHAAAHAGRHGFPTQALAVARVPAQLMGSGSAVLALAKGILGNKPLEEREKWLNLSSMVGGAGMAPVLADEALASRNALKLLREAKGGLPVFPRMNQVAARQLSRAFGSYGLGALALVLGPQLAKAYYRRQYD